MQFQNIPPLDHQQEVQPVYMVSEPTSSGLWVRGAACLYSFTVFTARKSQHADLQGQCFFYIFSYFIRFGLEIISMPSLRHWCISVAGVIGQHYN